MKIDGEGLLVRVYIGESDRWGSEPLYEAIVKRARAEGLPAPPFYVAWRVTLPIAEYTRPRSCDSRRTCP